MVNWFGRALGLLALLVPLSPSERAPLQELAPTSLGDSGREPRSAAQLFGGFIQNQGQWDSGARFVADFGRMVVRAEAGMIVLQAPSTSEGRTRLGVARLVFEGAEAAEPTGGVRTSSLFHYFEGNDRSRWRRFVPSYADVVYADLYAGMDLRLYQRDGRCEYDLLLSPTARVSDFRVRCEGVDSIAVDRNGDLRMDTPSGVLLQLAPTAQQVMPDGRTLPATCRFRILDERHFGLEVTDRVPGSSLVIDPGLTWATFLGGAGTDRGQAVRILADGSVLVLSRTDSRDFPTTAGTFDTTVDAQDMSLSCFDPSGRSLVFSTVVGGTGSEVPTALSVAADGRIAIGGATTSPDYPTLASAYDSSLNNDDACLTVLAPDASDLLFSTLIGGACFEEVRGVAFTSTGSIVAAGNTCSQDYPTTPTAFQPLHAGVGFDGFLSWFDPSLSGAAQLVCSTFLGSTSTEEITDLAIGLGDEPIVVGQTQSPDFPTTPGAYDETPAINDGFVTRLSADGATLVASTHFKGGKPNCVRTDGDTILIAGYSGPLFPASPNAYDPSPNGFHDCFVARFDAQCSQLLAGTLIGGSKTDAAGGICVDGAGHVIIVGATGSPNYPTTPGAFDTLFDGFPSGSTSMVSCLSSDLSQLLYSSYLGTASTVASYANGVAAIGVSDVIMVGEGAHTGFPVTPGAFQEIYQGGNDGYVARMLMDGPWGYCGGAISGSSGKPSLQGSGSLVGGHPVTLTLTGAKAVAPAILIVGVSQLGLPFKGGTLIPSPDILIFGLSTNAHGMLTLSSTWPSGLPSGFMFLTQYWIADSAGPVGFAASNGLSGTTP